MKSDNKSLTIVSLGWLGLKLYRHIIKNSTYNFHKVSGSYCHTPKNIEDEYRFDINVMKELPSEVLNSDIIFFNLPPSRIDSIQVVEEFLNRVKDKKVIFISSTSVYGQEGDLDESTIPRPKTKNGIFLLEIENYIKKNIEDYIIIRPGGLYDNARHPIYHLSNKETNMGTEEVINLISGKDLIDIIMKSMDRKNITINAINENHPNKRKFYQELSTRLSIAPPKFCSNHSGVKRIIKTTHSDFRVKSNLFELSENL